MLNAGKTSISELLDSKVRTEYMKWDDQEHWKVGLFYVAGFHLAQACLLSGDGFPSQYFCCNYKTCLSFRTNKRNSNNCSKMTFN